LEDAMSEATPEVKPNTSGDQESGEQQQQQESQQQPGEDQLGDPGKRALAAERQARLAAESQAKSLRRELDGLKTAQMSESERAVAEAREAGRREATTTYSKQLASAEFRAAAKEQNVDVKDVLDYIDTSKFINADDGSVDTKAIEIAVTKFAAGKKPATANDFNGGTREPAQTNNMNDLIRGQLGIR
jgi:hypothetical protein